jgi:hypothetical protein
MIKQVTLGLYLIAAFIASPAVGRDPDDTKTLRSVRDYLDAHWEYPNFIPDEASGLKIMAFQIREGKCLKIYTERFYQAMRLRPDETVCFRLIGKGFLAPRQRSFMQPWEGNQFIFVKIKKLERLTSDEKCASPPKSNGS